MLLAALGLCGFVCAFTSCRERGLLVVPAALAAEAPGHKGSAAGARRFTAVVHRPSCSVSCGAFLDQGSNPCPLHWQAGFYLLRYQGSPSFDLLIKGQCIYEKVLDGFSQVYLCNQNPDKRKSYQHLRPSPVPSSSSIPSLHNHTPDF